MTDEEATRPRRSDRHRKPEPETVPEAASPGYRATKRSSKAGKKARQAEKAGRVQEAFATLVLRVGRGIAMLLATLLVVAVTGGLVFLVITGINQGARWQARRAAETAARGAEARKVRENVVVIAVQERQATGFLAMRVDRKTQRVFGIAIPDGAFVEVPGQGFERIGDSYKAGADVSVSTVQNYLGVPFDYYIVVDDGLYKQMVKDQDVSGMLAAVVASNLTAKELEELGETLKTVPGKNVGLAPLPVRSVNIGNMTYYEPQREQIADLLYSWWGVKGGASAEVPRAIIYNGAGSPGIAGVAARELIKAGFRVVDTGNADRFDYAKTQIVILRGDPGAAARVQDILGTGEIVTKQASQDITDVIVIVGRDYKAPPATN